MKKALLFALASLFFVTSYAQTGGRYGGYFGGDTVIYVNNFPRQVLNDSTWPPLKVTSPPSSIDGFLTGMNSANVVGYAECYQPNLGGAPSADSAFRLLGVYSIWTGTYNTSSKEYVKVAAWVADTTMIQAYDPISGNDSIRSFPGKVLDSTWVSVTKLNIGSGPYTTNSYRDLPITIFFPAPVAVSKPFFVGYEGPYTSSTSNVFYTWGATGIDTIAIRSTGQGYQVGASNFYYNKGIGSKAYKMYHSRNAWEAPPANGSGWYDLTSNPPGPGTAVNLAIVPIVEAYSTLGVQGISNKNLTFYGNYPNPVQNSTTIKYGLANTADVTILVMDMAGHTLQTVNQPAQTSGTHTYLLNTSNVAAGDYIYTVRTSDGAAMAGKMTVVR